MLRTTYKFTSPLFPDESESIRHCDHPGCLENGLHRAPKSANQLNDYYWFCFDHAAAYNKSWNYYADRPAEEIERDRVEDVTWRRPTWPFNRHKSRKAHLFDGEDLFGIFDDAGGTAHQYRYQDYNPDFSHLPGEVRAALSLFNFSVSPSKDDLKSRYKDLVKKHHPDTHKEDPKAEETLKAINIAYGLLKEHFL